MFFAVNLAEYTQALPSGNYRAVEGLKFLVLHAGVSLLLEDGNSLTGKTKE